MEQRPPTSEHYAVTQRAPKKVKINTSNVASLSSKPGGVKVSGGKLCIKKSAIQMSSDR